MSRGKDKLRRFQENLTFSCLVQPEFEDIFKKDYLLKGNWGRDFFGNDNPIILELGCGRGEYTVSMGEMFPQYNFIGIDIKGARLWRGAKTATETPLKNVGFLRTRIEFIESFFASEEIEQIWITFPDPQLYKTRIKKRLTAPQFLEWYAGFLKTDGFIHLKTDSRHLHDYTVELLKANELPVYECCTDLYGTGYANELLSVKTTYEQRFLEEGLDITYLRFGLGGRKNFENITFEPDNDLKR